jgi:hypothetical protein
LNQKDLKTMTQSIKPNAEYYAYPEDLDAAREAAQSELTRLGLKKQSPVVMLWLETKGYKNWNGLDLAGFRALEQFLAGCEPS